MKNALLAGVAIASLTTIAAPASAQHAKPVVSREVCKADDGYDLVPSGAPTQWRKSPTGAEQTYDPNGEAISCGAVNRAQPLECRDAFGNRASDQNKCEPAAMLAYQAKTGRPVQRNQAVQDLSYYTIDTTSVGRPRMASSITLHSADRELCIQIAEVEVYANGVNVALASNGATATGSDTWSWESTPDKAIDGVRPAPYPQIFHSLCRSPSEFLTIKFAKPVLVDSLVVYGRNEYWGYRDIYSYTLYDGDGEAASGIIDSRNGPNRIGTTSFATCDQADYVWKSVPGSTSGVCGTQDVAVAVSCINAATGATVDDGQCSAYSKPATSRRVTSTDGCSFDYSASAWSVVPPSCGEVTQTRAVRCVGADGSTATEASCANSLTPPADRLATGISTNEYWSKGPYPWTGAAGNSITIWKMPSPCDVGQPEDVRKECEARYVGKNGTNQSYLRPRESRTVSDSRSCVTTPADQYAGFRWNDPTYVPDRTGVCGENTRTARVFCMRESDGQEVESSLCDASKKPASRQTFQDASGCTPPPEIQNPAPTEIQLGTCNYTSSGGGRYACGDRYTYRPGPAAPYASELCSGNVLAGGDRSDLLDGNYQTPMAGKGWSKQPVLEKVAGAKCVVHWRLGYSDSNSAGWASVYYSGPATGREGGVFIGKKP